MANRSKVSLDNFLNVRYNYFQLPYQFHSPTAHSALAALHASVRIPGRGVEGEVALFVLGGSGREHAVARHLGDGEEFAVALDDFCGRGVVYGRSPHGPCGAGYILGAIICAYACRSPPRTKPRYASLVPKGSLSLTPTRFQTTKTQSFPTIVNHLLSVTDKRNYITKTYFTSIC